MRNKIGLSFAVFLSISVLLGWSAPAAGLEMLVKPYLNYPTTNSIVVRWETDAPASSLVRWGDKVPLEETTAVEGKHTFHDVTITGLETGAPYFYQVVSHDDAGNENESEVYTFGTAVDHDTAFGFVVICDTQANPDVVRRLAEYAYAQRPAFTLLGGDLVSDGREKDHWTGHFFPNMEPLNTRVPLVPILGNHENNAHYFYDYFTLPDPEYYYQLAISVHMSCCFRLPSRRRLKDELRCWHR